MPSDELQQTGVFARFNRRATESFVGRYFELEERHTTFFQELRAGVVAFLTVCYIIPVNSGILSDTGGICDPATACSAGSYAAAGADCRFFDNDYAACKADFKNSLIASTCIAAMLGTLLMSVWARMPLAVAPAMGVNAYFTYTVVGYLATKRVSYKSALAAVFVEGWIFVAISVSGVRGKIVELIPKNLMNATACGIGAFLAFIGLQQSEGLGFITFDGATLVTLGGCEPQYRDYMYVVGDAALTYDNICASTNDSNGFSWTGVNALGPKSANYTCTGGTMRSATTWLGIVTGLLMVVLMMKDVKASILVGILFCTFVSWIPGTKVSYVTADSPIAGGEFRAPYFKKGVTLPDTSMTAGQLDFASLSQADVWVALITFLYLDFLDATSTMFAMARLVAEVVPGFLDDKGHWPRQTQTMVCDGLAIVIGSLMGTSPLTVFAESAVGIREGGRSGITSLVVALGFGVSMFLSPIFSSIPPYATGPAIILVGAMMMEHARYIAWDSIRTTVPAFLTILLMPLTYSIAYGILCGLSLNIMLWVADGVWEFSKTALGLYHGKKTFRHCWLEMMDTWYIAFDKEHVLMAEIPGYVRHVPEHMQHGAKATVENSFHVETAAKPVDRADSV